MGHETWNIKTTLKKRGEEVGKFIIIFSPSPIGNIQLFWNPSLTQIFYINLTIMIGILKFWSVFSGKQPVFGLFLRISALYLVCNTDCSCHHWVLLALMWCQFMSKNILDNLFFLWNLSTFNTLGSENKSSWSFVMFVRCWAVTITMQLWCFLPTG